MHLHKKLLVTKAEEYEENKSRKEYFKTYSSDMQNTSKASQIYPLVSLIVGKFLQNYTTLAM